MLKAAFTKKLWHFDLDIQLEISNEIVVLWGPSGAGKTTALHCLAGLRHPTTGYIKLNDRIVYSLEHKINIPTRSRKIGYLFQDYALFPHMTVKQNVFYGIKNHKTDKSAKNQVDPTELLFLFGVGHLMDRYPQRLSGGEKQRVALARALAVRPELLLLDEPFSALDRENKIKLREELKDLHKLWNIPFLLVTHDEDDADFLGDKVVYIGKGLSTS